MAKRHRRRRRSHVSLDGLGESTHDAKFWIKAKTYVVTFGLFGGLLYLLTSKGASADTALPEGGFPPTGLAPPLPSGTAPYARVKAAIASTALTATNVNGDEAPYAAGTTPLGGSPAGATIDWNNVQPSPTGYALTPSGGQAGLALPAYQAPRLGPYAIDPTMSPGLIIPKPNQPVRAYPQSAQALYVRVPLPDGQG